MARHPSFFRTFVATRSMSPESFILWKTVQVPPTSFWASSTTGVVAEASAFCPSQESPAIIRGSSTELVFFVNWFTALQVAVSGASLTAPVRRRTSRATFSE
jgi:hypothetical protein